MPGIKDEKSLRAWLETRPREDAIVIASRAALRSLPGMTSLFLSDMINDRYAIILSLFRANAVTWVAGNGPIPRQRVMNAARSAARSAADHTAYFGARSRARSAYSTAYFAACSAADVATYVFRDRTEVVDGTGCHGDAENDGAPQYTSENHVHQYKKEKIAPQYISGSDEPQYVMVSEDRNQISTRRHDDDGFKTNLYEDQTALIAPFISDDFSAWNAIEKDAQQLESGAERIEVLASALWPDDPSEELAEAWPTLRDTLLGQDPSWQVWTDWYQDRLDDKPINERLEIEKALIPDEDWEQGPSHVNAIIAELIAKHSKHPNETITILEWLGGNALRLALADWNLDQMDQFMQLVPFSNDYRDLTSDAEKQARREGLRTLRDALTEMAEDVEDLRLNQQWVAQLIRDLQRYAKEANKGADRALPGNLQRHGRNLRETCLNAECAKTLGETMTGRLGGLVDEHTNWMRLYLSGTLQRMQHLNEVTLPAGMTSDDLTKIIRAGVDAVINNDWSAVKPAAEDDKAVLIDMAESMERLNEERDASTNDPARQAYLDEEIRRNGIISGATLVRFGLQSAKATKEGVAVAADAKTLWPESFDSFFEAIRTILE